MNIESTHSQNFLQVSSKIIGKHRYRSDVTGMININSLLSPRPAINQTPQVPVLGRSEAETTRAILPLCRAKTMGPAYIAPVIKRGCGGA